MLVKQMSVFVENETGRLTEIARILKESNINIRAMCIAETADYGILRCIVDDPEHAAKVLRENGKSASIVDVIAVELDDEVGGLLRVLELLSAEKIGIEYVYSTIRSRDDHALIVMKVSEPEKTALFLKGKGIKLFCLKDFM